MKKPVGWRKEPGRHALAAKGIKSGRAIPGHDPHVLKHGQLITEAVKEYATRLQNYNRARGSSKRVTLERFYEAGENLEKAFKAAARDSNLPKPFKKNFRTGPNGVQYLYRYPNGMGASVIMNNTSYGGRDGFWELQTVKWTGKSWMDHTAARDLKDSELQGERGWLTSGDVKRLLKRVQKLPKSGFPDVSKLKFGRR